MWDFEAIDNADITDEKNRVFEMEPMYESKVSTYHIFSTNGSLEDFGQNIGSFSRTRICKQGLGRLG